MPTLTASFSGFVNGDTAASLSVQPVLSTVATAASHVGSYAKTASGAADSDYTISYLDGKLTVNAANLTITADNVTKTFGSAVPTLTATFSGFVNGDTADSLAVQPLLTTNATAASPVGSYAISVSLAVDPDYVIDVVDGILTININPGIAAPLIGFADNQAITLTLGTTLTIQSNVSLVFSNSSGITSNLSFTWTVRSSDGTPLQTTSDPDLSFTPTAVGAYSITLAVRDDNGGSDQKTLLLTVFPESTTITVVEPGEFQELIAFANATIAAIRNDTTLSAQQQAQQITEIVAQQALLTPSLAGTSFIIWVFDPVDFVITNATGGEVSYTQSGGFVNTWGPNVTFSGAGANELVVIPVHSAGTYSLELIGVGTGEYRAGVSFVSAAGEVTTQAFGGTLVNNSNTVSVLDFGASESGTPVFNTGGQAMISAAGGTAPTSTLLGRGVLAFADDAARAIQQLSQTRESAGGKTRLFRPFAQALDTVTRTGGRFLKEIRNALESPLKDLLPQKLLPEVKLDSSVETKVLDMFWGNLGQRTLGIPTNLFRFMDRLTNGIPAAGEPATDQGARVPDQGHKQQQPAAEQPGNQKPAVQPQPAGVPQAGVPRSDATRKIAAAPVPAVLLQPAPVDIGIKSAAKAKADVPDAESQGDSDAGTDSESGE